MSLDFEQCVVIVNTIAGYFVEASSLSYRDFEMHKETHCQPHKNTHTYIYTHLLLVENLSEMNQTCMDSDFTFLCAWEEGTGAPGRLSSLHWPP